jgi:hypothetical protein
MTSRVVVVVVSTSQLIVDSLNISNNYLKVEANFST